jgi:Tol biopolymer transport system component
VKTLTRIATIAALGIAALWVGFSASAREQERIVVEVYTGGPSDIYIMNADGSDFLNLTQQSESRNRWPAPSPDGRQIAFTSRRNGRFVTYVMDIDGSNVRRVGDGSMAEWSPDGSRLVVTGRPGEGDNVDLYILDVETGALTQLTDRANDDNHADWSPDGRHIAFQSHEGGEWFNGNMDTSVSVVDVQTGVVTRLTDEPGRESSPRWSPDGSRIAFNNEAVEMLSMDTDGGAVRDLSEEVGSNPDWSADGSRIVYGGFAHAVRFDDTSDTYVMDADGRNGSRIQMHRGPMLGARWLRAASLAVNPFRGRPSTWGWLKGRAGGE